MKIDFNDIWRRERDSNPRYGFPYTRVPGVRLQPLGHLSRALHYTQKTITCKLKLYTQNQTKFKK